MRVGILGSGLMGGKLGTLFARAGHDVVFSYARSERKLKKLARDAKGNARAGTPAEAAKDADAVLVAVHWSRINDVLRQAGDLAGKVVVTCSLPMNADDTDLVVAHTSSGAEALAKKVPDDSSPRSIPCRARCSSACSRPAAAPGLGRAWCTAATRRPANVWPPG
jgi:8-hydroxy-5-deazaflavin:NADPH oxidoreductase